MAAVLDQAVRRSSAQVLRSTISKRATPETLAPIASPKAGPIRLLVAARIGTTRLIDNVAV